MNDPFETLKRELIEGYKAKIKGVSPLLFKGMISAYSDGINSVISWIHDVEKRSQYFEKMKVEMAKEIEVKSP